MVRSIVGGENNSFRLLRSQKVSRFVLLSLCSFMWKFLRHSFQLDVIKLRIGLLRFLFFPANLCTTPIRSPFDLDECLVFFNTLCFNPILQHAAEKNDYIFFVFLNLRINKYCSLSNGWRLCCYKERGKATCSGGWGAVWWLISLALLTPKGNHSRMWWLMNHTGIPDI